MSDVSVVLLSIGEETAVRALESVRRQTVQPASVIEVRDVRPFHRALNAGAARVETPLFVQVDADMVLDPTCIERLRAVVHADPAIGVAVAFLRDPLMERVSGVKLFRRACFDAAAFRDTISPDTDFIDEIRRAGWRDVYLLDHARPDPSVWHTAGAHEPAYGAQYTFTKCTLEGARYRYRGDGGGLRWHLGVLQRSRHAVAPLARLAFLNGVFARGELDLLGRPGPSDDFAAAVAFMASRHEDPVRVSTAAQFVSLRPAALFGRYFALGAALRRAGAYPAFERVSGALAASGDRSHWVAQAGLCRGALAPDSAAASEEFALLRPLLPAAAQRLKEKASDLLRLVRRATGR